MKNSKQYGLSFISFIIILVVLWSIVYIGIDIYKIKMNDTNESVELVIPPQRAK